MVTLPHTDDIEAVLDGEWLTLWFNRPEVKNALSSQMIAELTGVLQAVAPDRSVRGITLRGRGGVFCAGGDIKTFKSVFQGGALSKEDVAEGSREAGRLFHLINEMPQVVVMAIEGAAMAGGLGIACAGDVVLATEDARFALTETTLGIPPAQIAPLVIGRVGLAAARRLMLTAARFEGAEAQRLGLVDVLVPDADGLEAEEAAIRKAVLRCAPDANAVTKRIALACRTVSGADMIDLAADGFAGCMLGEEGREGVAAFVEKRRPRWTETKE